MDRATAADWLWHDAGVAATFVRSALRPASMLYGAVVSRRNTRFDLNAGVVPVALPALSVGNLTVGGTGKTPVAAWCAAQLASAGARPAIVLRGYGDDEWRVHALLSPNVPVVVNRDRVVGIADAAGQAADVVVLDDAFQHRRAARVADLVLLSADAWTGSTRLLPAGPWREPLRALRRATVAVITVKAASAARVDTVMAAVHEVAPGVPVAVVGILPGSLRPVGQASQPAPEGASEGAPRERDTADESIGALRGQRVGVVSGIGDPAAFEAQIAGVGAQLDVRRYPDHHAYSDEDVASMLSRWSAGGTVDRVVCTLKDAVKLGPRWPRVAPPLWYVSQTIEVRLGSDALQSALGQVLAARRSPHAASLPTAG